MGFLSDILPAVGSAIGYWAGGSTGAQIGGTIGGAIGGSMAASSAASAQVAGATQAGNLSAAQQATTMNNLAPYMSAGASAMGSLDALLGIGNPSAAGSSVSRATTQAVSTSSGNGSQFGVGGGYQGNPILTGGGSAYNTTPNPRAMGGPVNGGTRYVIGEHGPEVLEMAPGSRGFVKPNPNTPSPYPHAQFRGGRAMGGIVGQADGNPSGPDVGQYKAQFASSPQTPASPSYTATDPTVGYNPASVTPSATAATPNATTFDPTASNDTALTSGMTPSQIMQQTPQYQFAEQQGIQALDNSAAASGGLLTGGHIKDILNYSQGLASQQFQNIYSNLMGVASLGSAATSMDAETGMYSAMGQGSAAQAAGNASASGTLGSFNAVQGGMQNLFYGLGTQNTGTLAPTTGAGSMETYQQQPLNQIPYSSGADYGLPSG